MTESRLRVLNVGLSLSSHGGIANNQRRVLNSLRKHADVKHVSSIVARWGESRLLNAARFMAALLRTSWLLITWRPDVVHLRMSQRGSVWRKCILIRLVNIFRVPIVVHAHGSEFEQFFAGLSAPLQSIVRECMRRVAAFICLGDAWKRYYLKTLSLPTAILWVLPNPVEVPATVPHRTVRQSVQFCFLGRLGKRKGAFDLVEAFSDFLVTTSAAECHLVLAGDGEVQAITGLARARGTSDNIVVLDWLGPEARDELLRTSDVFVLPTYNEGMPLALLEAMSWGLPVITTPVGGIPDVVRHGENGLLVPPGGRGELSAAMERMVVDHEGRQLMGRAARATAERHDVGIYVTELMAIYRSAVERHAR